MIQTLRKDMQKMRHILWVVLASLVAGMIGGLLTDRRPHSAFTAVAQIEPYRVPIYTYEFLYQVRTIENMRHMIWNMLMQGQLSFEMLSFLGDFQKPAPEVALKQLKEQKLVQYAADTVRLSLDPAYFAQRLAEQLSHDPSFATMLFDERGQIKEAAYREFLERNYALSIATFEALKAEDVRREQFKGCVDAGGYVPTWRLKDAFNMANATKQFAVLPVTQQQFLDEVNTLNVGNEELAAFYEQHIKEFEVPEARAATYWVFDTTILGKTFEPADEDTVAAYYEKNKDLRFKKGESEHYKPLESVRSEIISTLRAAAARKKIESDIAEALHASRQDSQALASVARRFGADTKNLPLTSKESAEKDTSMTGELVRELFAKNRATARNNGMFVNGDMVILFQETERREAATPALEAVHDRVLEAYRAQQARTKCKEFTKNAQRELLGGSATLEEVAKRISSAVCRTPHVHSSETFSLAPGAPRLYEKAFLLTSMSGQVLKYKTDQGYMLVVLVGQTLPTTTEYQAQEAALRERVAREEKGRLYTSFVASLTRNATIKTNKQYEKLQHAFSAAQ